ncbi:acylneuraminate cytidylyltransferase family protein [Neobacillus sp.]|uniref:acylneuraminate cytidylyltransferase family protein n=1 Tax=Neobacillus sp. TaxID=2675273 RepID=UPI002898FBB0|nr:acylneuraminate cytidylyltransferase family protein [Neobacillus sp.]
MLNNKTVLAIIPARGGSKGIPRKNIRDLAGKPLIAWTIGEGKKSKYIDRIILSSEDSEIIEVAKAYGAEVPFIRPRHLAEDQTPGIDPVIHALKELPNYDFVVLLQPTSPMRQVEDIDGCIEKMFETGAPACVSVTYPEKSPYWMYTIKDNELIEPLIPQNEIVTRRQELPIVYSLNGAVYVARTDRLLETKSFITTQTSAYIMPNSRSYDIDTEDDFLLCEFLIKKKVNSENKLR